MKQPHDEAYHAILEAKYSEAINISQKKFGENF